jgi:hypothetical protein
MMEGFLGIRSRGFFAGLFSPLRFRFRGITIGSSSSLSSSADKSSSLSLKSFRSASLKSYPRDNGSTFVMSKSSFPQKTKIGNFKSDLPSLK